jgi:uncharacterized protein (DUF885 family)
MDTLLRKMGLTEGSVKERMAKLQEDQPKFPATEQGRADYMADIEKTMRDAEKRAALLFDRVPKAPVVAQPYPSFMGQRAASYNFPAPDGSRPGTFQYTFAPGRSKFSHSTIYHETVPGHHFQMALQLEDANLPRFRQLGIFGFNSAFGEGWGRDPMWARIACAVLGFFVATATTCVPAIAQEKRIALVIGNQSYDRSEAVDIVRRLLK